jgi:hypothetical protein
MRENDVHSSLLCGAIAGIIAKITVAPAERVKLTFQVHLHVFTLRNALAHAQQIVKNASVFGLWKGKSAQILRVGPYAALSYASHDAAQHLFRQHLGTENLPFLYKFLAGSISGVVSTVFTYPLDVLRVRLALGAGWKGALQQGGLFQGQTPTVVGIVPYVGTSWAVKSTLF